MVVQLVGRDPRWIAEAARLAAAAGADVIDLNMGCPAREVTGAACGSALMRDLDLAEQLIERRSAPGFPSPSRCAWAGTRPAATRPELAVRAERLGVGARRSTPARGRSSIAGPPTGRPFAR